jgi:hypothetical protein
LSSSCRAFSRSACSPELLLLRRQPAPRLLQAVQLPLVLLLFRGELGRVLAAQLLVELVVEQLVDVDFLAAVRAGDPVRVVFHAGYRGIQGCYCNGR